MAELLFKDPRDYILFEHQLRKNRRPAYSMRAFARDLEVSPSSLNDFMKARVGMSLDRVEKIAGVLSWTPTRTEHFRDLILSKYDKDKGVRQSALMRVRTRLKEGSYALSLDAFKTISDWYHLVIVEMCEIQDHLKPGEIASRLGLSLSESTQALKRLVKLELLKETNRGLKPSDETSYYMSATPSEAIRSFHSQVLEMAQKFVLEGSMVDHQSQALVFSMDREDIAQMYEDVYKAVLNVVNRYAQVEKRNDIQILSLQIFPAMKNTGKKQ